MIPAQLTDAAIAMLQVEPGDVREITALRDGLKQFAVFDDGVAPQVRAQAQHAATQLTLILLGGGDDESLLREASIAIDHAIRLAEGGTGATPVSSCDRDPIVAHDGGDIAVGTDLSLLADFVAESRDSLRNAEAALLELEANPDDAEAVNTVFRAFHTVKGTAGFMGLDRLADFAHHAESLLSRVRDRDLAYTQPLADLALRSSDILAEFLDAIEVAVAQHERIALPAGHAAVMRDLLDVDAVLARGQRADAAPHPRAGTDRALNKPDVESAVRVRVDRLDRLMDLVGELVIAQSMIAGDPAVSAPGQHDLLKKVAHADGIMRELQELSMSMRMVPLKGTFQKLARLVRDVALKAGKVVELDTAGSETELDRSMVDAIADPLVHMVRNAIDHGIESPADRVAAGKPEAGRLRLSAFQQGGSVVIELRDDGRGLNRERIRAKAIEKGVITATQSLSDADIHALIFAPGFSTAESLTDISGRGVGMDVVRRNIESVRGRIEIQSEHGSGTTFQLRLPLTLAVTDGMLAQVGNERYIVPLTSIALSFRAEASMLSTIPSLGDVVMLRGEVLPLLRLHELFGADNAITEPTLGILMIVSDGTQRVALLVDQLIGQQQVVAKPLGSGVGTVAGISGGAILSDGRIGLIIDVPGLLHSARSPLPRQPRIPHAA